MVFVQLSGMAAEEGEIERERERETKKNTMYKNKRKNT